VLVRNVDLQASQDELNRAILTDAGLVRHYECLRPTGALTNPGAAGCVQVDPTSFTSRLTDDVVPSLGPARLLLLDPNRVVIFDSAGTAIAEVIAAQPGARGPTIELDGQTFQAAAAQITPARDPIGARYVVVARAQSSVTAAAAGELLPRLLIAGGVALLVALVLVLALSRSVTSPMSQLAGAAEDIAAGNYARRVGIRGADEIGSLGAAFDRMAEAVERARRVQRDFLANVSHELKTPLTSLIGFSQALIDGSLKTEDEQKRAAQIVHEESERVLRMAQELLDLARVEAGTISLHITAVDLAAQLEQELEIVRPRAVSRGLALQSEIPADTPPVAADPERLHQVLGNLLDNAVKYAPPGTPVTIGATRNGNSIELSVANAPGPDRPDPQRMFDRFYRSDPSRSSAAGGVGLGLAISRELAVAMGGSLTAGFNSPDRLSVRLVLPVREQVET
jgi:signal transduction histidine kinase